MLKTILATVAVATTLVAAALPSHHSSAASSKVLTTTKAVKSTKAVSCNGSCNVSSCPKGSGGDCSTCPYASCGG